jgi:cytochrome c553
MMNDLMQIPAMSTIAMLQMKQQLSKMSEKQRQEISAFLHRLKQDSPAWKKEMSRRMAEMDAGKKFKLPKTPVRD